jgi:predicted exporter
MWKRIYVSALFIIVIALAVISSGQLNWSENVTDILPQSPELNDYAELVRVFRPDDRVFFLVKKKSDAVPEKKLIEAADRLVSRLEGLEMDTGKLFPRVIYRQDIDPLEAIDFFLTRQGTYFEPGMEETAGRRLNAQWLTQRFADIKEQLLKSPAPGLLKLVANDPLDLSGANFETLRDLLPTAENIRLHRGRLFSEDLGKILVIAEPAARSTDIAQARVLVDRVEQIIADIRSTGGDIEVAWMAGHRFSVDNSSIIRGDVTRIFIISSLLIITLIALTLRRLVGVLVLALPSIFGLSLAFSLVTVTRGTVSAIALGMAAILTGITIDYAIHILCRGRALGNAHRAAANLRRPLIMAAATTAIAFGALHFSRIAVMRQLGEIAVFSVIGAVVFALFCLPVVLTWAGLTGKKGFYLDIGGPARRLFSLHHKKRLLLLVLLSLALIPGLGMLSVEDDLQNFNAMRPDSRRDFQEIGEFIEMNRKTVFIAVHGEDLQDVLERSRRLFSLLEEMEGEGLLKQVSSIASIIPPRSAQADNRNRWREYWNEQRRGSLAEALKEAAARSGMVFAVFQPYLRRLANPGEACTGIDDLPSSLRQLIGEHMRSDGAATYILTRLEPADNCDVLDMTTRLRAEIPGLLAADMGLLRHSAMKLFIDGLLRLGGIVILLVGAFLLVLLRDLRRLLALILPLLLTVLWTFGMLGWLHIKIDATSSIVSVIIFGLVIDYSIFITDSIIKRGRSDEETATVSAAITLSGLSTIMGFGSLILAGHPVLFKCGVTAIIGTCGGLLAVSLSSFIYERLLKKTAGGDRSD